MAIMQKKEQDWLLPLSTQPKDGCDDERRGKRKCHRVCSFLFLVVTMMVRSNDDDENSTTAYCCHLAKNRLCSINLAFDKGLCGTTLMMYCRFWLVICSLNKVFTSISIIHDPSIIHCILQKKGASFVLFKACGATIKLACAPVYLFFLCSFIIIHYSNKIVINILLSSSTLIE